MPSSWTAADIPSQVGRTVVVTGANSGLGLVTARELSRAGAAVVLAVRDPSRGEQAAATMNGDVTVRRLDLADLESVRALAATWSGDLDDLNWQRRPYSANGAYAQSKLANLLFTLELQRRLAAAGSRVRALGAHPGYAATNLQGRSGSRLKDGAMKLGNRILAQSDEGGALPTLAAATRDLPGGSYVGPCGFQELRGNPTLVGRTPEASDPELARRLWEESARLTGVDFPVAA